MAGVSTGLLRASGAWPRLAAPAPALARGLSAIVEDAGGRFERRRRGGAGAGAGGAGGVPDEITDEDIRGRETVYLFSGVSPDEKASRLSDAAKDRLWHLHSSDPERWTVDQLAAEYRIRKQRVMAILMLKDLEKAQEERDGKPLDDSLERAIEDKFGTVARADGERHHKEVVSFPYPEELAKDVSAASEEERQKQKRMEQDEASAKEEIMLVKHFEQRLSFNKKQMEGVILTKRESRRRPPEGWSYLVEELGREHRRGLSGGKKFVALPDGSQRDLNELEKMYVKRETIIPRRRVSPR